MPGCSGCRWSTRPDSPEFYGLTLGVAGTWLGGACCPGRCTWAGCRPGRPTSGRWWSRWCSASRRSGAFYGAALVARHVSVLSRAVTSVLQYAVEGTGPLVLLTTLANGAAEEVFFRGALFAAVGPRYPVPKSTSVYALATTATRNPALVIASTAMGTLFALQRRATGGIQAPLLTHLTWSALTLRYVPPLFRDVPATGGPSDRRFADRGALTIVPPAANALEAIEYILPAALGVPLTRPGSHRPARRHRPPEVTP